MVLMAKSARQTAASKLRIESLPMGNGFPLPIRKESKVLPGGGPLKSALTVPSSPVVLSTCLLLAMLQQIHLPTVLPTTQAFFLLRSSPCAVSSAWNRFSPYFTSTVLNVADSYFPFMSQLLCNLLQRGLS